MATRWFGFEHWTAGTCSMCDMGGAEKALPSCLPASAPTLLIADTMQTIALAAVAAPPRAGALAPAGPRRRQLVRPWMRCSATVSEETARAQGQAAGGQQPGGGNGALAGAAAPASQQLPQLPKLPVNQTVCMEGEAQARGSRGGGREAGEGAGSAGV